MIGIIDYGMGNLRSVQKALQSVGAQASILASPEAPMVDRLILPGVGAFADGMTHLRQRGWLDYLHAYLKTERPFLGICLGMQLLFEGSEEDTPDPGQLVPGMSILPGRVVRFRRQATGVDAHPIKIPHMGWNTLRHRYEDPLFSGIEQEAAVYFVHCYFVQPQEDPSGQGVLTSSTTHHGSEFCASIRRDHIWATQFHPEKSQAVGLRMLANFSTV